MNGYIKYIFIFLFVALGSIGFYYSQQAVSHSQRAKAIIGELEIRDQDISYRIGIEKAYGADLSPEAALVALVNDVLEEEVAKLNKVTVTAEDIEQLSKSADENSKAPEILKNVKEVFGNDFASYNRIYLKPKIVNVKLHYFYSRDPLIHSSEIEKIEKARDAVTEGKSFEEASNEYAAVYKVDEIGGEGTAMPDIIKQYLPEESKNFQDPLIKIVSGLKEGEMYNNIVEDDYSYQIVRLIKKEGSKYKIESVIVAKSEFDKWFNNEAEKVKVKILDKVLKESIKTDYPQVSWVKGI